MPTTAKFRQLQQVIHQVMGAMPARSGEPFPMHLLCAQAAQLNLSRNDVVDYLQSLKNQRLLTANERLTDAFIDAMRATRAA